MDRAHMIRGRPLQAQTEPQSEMIAGVTLATNLAERDLAVLQARLAASRYMLCVMCKNCRTCLCADIILSDPICL